jgi:hypothetical protein
MMTHISLTFLAVRMEGWICMGDDNRKLTRDLYSLGVTLWEIAHHAEKPVHPLKEVDYTTFDHFIRSLVVADASKRPNLDYVFEMLGGDLVCGCSEPKYV